MRIEQGVLACPSPGISVVGRRNAGDRLLHGTLKLTHVTAIELGVNVYLEYEKLEDVERLGRSLCEEMVAILGIHVDPQTPLAYGRSGKCVGVKLTSGKHGFVMTLFEHVCG